MLLEKIWIYLGFLMCYGILWLTIILAMVCEYKPLYILFSFGWLIVICIVCRFFSGFDYIRPDRLMLTIFAIIAIYSFIAVIVNTGTFSITENVDINTNPTPLSTKESIKPIDSKIEETHSSKNDSTNPDSSISIHGDENDAKYVHSSLLHSRESLVIGSKENTHVHFHIASAGTTELYNMAFPFTVSFSTTLDIAYSTLWMIFIFISVILLLIQQSSLFRINSGNLKRHKGKGLYRDKSVLPSTGTSTTKSKFKGDNSEDLFLQDRHDFTKRKGYDIFGKKYSNNSHFTFSIYDHQDWNENLEGMFYINPLFGTKSKSRDLRHSAQDILFYYTWIHIFFKTTGMMTWNYLFSISNSSLVISKRNFDQEINYWAIAQNTNIAGDSISKHPLSHHMASNPLVHFFDRGFTIMSTQINYRHRNPTSDHDRHTETHLNKRLVSSDESDNMIASIPSKTIKNVVYSLGNNSTLTQNCHRSDMSFMAFFCVNHNPDDGFNHASTPCLPFCNYKSDKILVTKREILSKTCQDKIFDIMYNTEKGNEEQQGKTDEIEDGKALKESILKTSNSSVKKWLDTQRIEIGSKFKNLRHKLKRNICRTSTASFFVWFYILAIFMSFLGFITVGIAHSNYLIIPPDLSTDFNWVSLVIRLHLVFLLWILYILFECITFHTLSLDILIDFNRTKYKLIYYDSIYRVINSGYVDYIHKNRGSKEMGANIQLLGLYLENLIDKYFYKVFQEDVNTLNDGSLDYLIYTKLTTFLFTCPVLFFSLFIKSISLILLISGILVFVFLCAIAIEFTRNYSKLDAKNYKYHIGIDSDGVASLAFRVFELYYSGIISKGRNGKYKKRKAKKRSIEENNNMSGSDTDNFDGEYNNNNNNNEDSDEIGYNNSSHGAYSYSLNGLFPQTNTGDVEVLSLYPLPYTDT